jgi:hypothetical protein
MLKTIWNRHKENIEVLATLGLGYVLYCLAACF